MDFRFLIWKVKIKPLSCRATERTGSLINETLRAVFSVWEITLVRCYCTAHRDGLGLAQSNTASGKGGAEAGTLDRGFSRTTSPQR